MGLFNTDWYSYDPTRNASELGSGGFRVYNTDMLLGSNITVPIDASQTAFPGAQGLNISTGLNFPAWVWMILAGVAAFWLFKKIK